MIVSTAASTSFCVADLSANTSSASAIAFVNAVFNSSVRFVVSTLFAASIAASNLLKSTVGTSVKFCSTLLIASTATSTSFCVADLFANTSSASVIAFVNAVFDSSVRFVVSTLFPSSIAASNLLKSTFDSSGASGKISFAAFSCVKIDSCSLIVAKLKMTCSVDMFRAPEVEPACQANEPSSN